jgi:hypothetical protein
MQLLERFATSPDGLTDNIIYIPKPDGTLAPFIFSNSQVLHPSLAAAHPDIKTFQGVQVNDPTVILRYDITPGGLHAQVISHERLFYVSPITDNIYISFYAENFSSSLSFDCDTANSVTELDHPSDAALRPLIHYGTTLRTYRLAVATTGEYTMAVGGTKTLALASIATAINFINSIYELEIGVRLQIIPTNLNIIYTDPSTDPYTPASGNSVLLTQNNANINAVIGSANYDIGHLFHALAGAGNSGSGVASIRAVCGVAKGRGVSTASRNGSLCDALINTNNAIPTVEAGLNYTIPRSTPFVLTGVGSEPMPMCLNIAGSNLTTK